MLNQTSKLKAFVAVYQVTKRNIKLLKGGDSYLNGSCLADCGQFFFLRLQVNVPSGQDAAS